MFTRQAPPLVTNLWQAGLSPAQASAIQNIFGQCRQALTHNGPVQYDYTRKDMRLIGPADATFKYPGMLFPSPENFPREPSTPDPLPLPPRPGSPPRNPSKEPDPRKVPGKGNKPGGHFPPDHLPVDPQMPDGPGEEPKFPGQPWGPNAFNGLWFAGEYINIDLPNRRIGLENNDARRHAVFPTNLNRKGRVNSVEFVDKPGGSSPEFVRIDITERPLQTIFSVESAGLQKIQYISGIDTSDPDKIIFERKEAWAFAPHDLTPFNIANCCACDCDCAEISGTQPAISFTSPNCSSALCPDPSPETCECPTVEGTIAPTSFNNYGATCSLAWDDDIQGCYTTGDFGVIKTAHIYVTVSCSGSGGWDINVVIYTAQNDAAGQIFTGSTNARLCVKGGKITGTVSGIELNNGTGTTCEIDLTFNP